MRILFYRAKFLVLICIATALNGIGLPALASEMQLQILHEFFPGPTNVAFPRGRPVEVQPGEFYGGASTNLGSIDEHGVVLRITSHGTVSMLAALEQGFYLSRIFNLKQTSEDTLYGLASTFVGMQLVRFRLGATPPLEVLGDDLGVDALAWDEVAYFYSVDFNGGDYGFGRVLRISTNGTSTVLHSFNGTNGARSSSPLVFGPDGNLYGTTAYGGVGFTGGLTGFGTVFRITTNGLLTPLVNFAGTNGAYPSGGLALGADGSLFGTTRGGGDFGFGTVFRVTPGGAFTQLASFDGTNGAGPYEIAQGADGNFYGLTSYGGIVTTNSRFGSFGIAYSVSTNGSLNVIARFDGTNVMNPYSDLLLANDGNLYGFTTDINARPSLAGNAGVFFRFAQAPRITSLMHSNGVALKWTAFTNGVYRVERKLSLVENWTALSSNVTSTGSVAGFTDSSPPETQSFYRVVLVP